MRKSAVAWYIRLNVATLYNSFSQPMVRGKLVGGTLKKFNLIKKKLNGSISQ